VQQVGQVGVQRSGSMPVAVLEAELQRLTGDRYGGIGLTVVSPHQGQVVQRRHPISRIGQQRSVLEADLEVTLCQRHVMALGRKHAEHVVGLGECRMVTGVSCDDECALGRCCGLTGVAPAVRDDGGVGEHPRQQGLVTRAGQLA
jgi:hypothetical protein